MLNISPVVPQGYRQFTPFWIRNSTCSSRAFTSTWSCSSKGVVIAVITPFIFFIFVSLLID